MAVDRGACENRASSIVGVTVRTLQRWREKGIGVDLRTTVKKAPPKNKISTPEYAEILRIVNSPEFRNLSPKVIVALLADRNTYIASESTMHRILKAEGQSTHRASSRPPHRRNRPRELIATARNQVWSWDITYLRSSVRGRFFYLYLVVDVWSRKVVGWTVEDAESSKVAADLIDRICERESVERGSLVLHADNGSPMKGADMVAKLMALGVEASHSRPSVSNDNPYSESLFRTMKYSSTFPTVAFRTIEEAREWVTGFVQWYNQVHLHCAIRFVTPAQRHDGSEKKILERRHRLYTAARERHPERWTASTRNWSPIETVRLNPVDAEPPKTAA